MEDLDKMLYTPILIYQMGKVGSSSVYASLKTANIPNSLFNIHQLSHNGFQRKESWLNFNNITNVHDELKYDKRIRSMIDSNRQKLDWKIITMTREPIGVEISGIFENINIFFKQRYDLNQKLKKDETLDFLYEHFDKLDITTNYYSNWFDEELKDVFDVDVYSKPYDFYNGFSFISKGNVSVLVIRLEDLKKSFTNAIYQFLGLERIELASENIGNRKVYSREYNEILEALSLPQSICEKMYTSKYAKHFYTKDEVSHFINKWSGKSTRTEK